MLRLNLLLNPRVPSRGCSLSTGASQTARSGEKQELFKMAFQVLSKYVKRLDGIDWTFSREQYDLINSTVRFFEDPGRLSRAFFSFVSFFFSLCFFAPWKTFASGFCVVTSVLLSARSCTKNPPSRWTNERQEETSWSPSLTSLVIEVIFRLMKEGAIVP
mmetsp:Transcript_36790/g.147140  ORF Transcript_36790/g.147140 Transcript_36790/m.147140 type:complete len:160 (+) Transcript_36790:608-1087(+)